MNGADSCKSKKTQSIWPSRWLHVSAVVNICFVLIIFGFTAFLSCEVHNVRGAYDSDIFGNHRCNLLNDVRYDSKLPPSINRPDEDLLWKKIIDDAVDRDRRGDTSYSIKGRTCVETMENNKQHFVREVRRTILEFEKGNDVNFPIYLIQCASRPGFNQHFTARYLVMTWYEEHNLLPNNFQRDYYE